MDERKSTIRELEVKKRVDIEARNQLLEGLGETLLQRIGEGDLFPVSTGNTPGGILVEYRRLQREIAESGDIIKSLEADTLRLKELETTISNWEEEKSRLEKELADVNVLLGKALLEVPGFDNLAGVLKQQEESLLARIVELEKKLAELEEREGGILVQVGKNAQIVVTKALLSKNRSDLQRVYSSAGEKYFSVQQKESEKSTQTLLEALDGEASGNVEKAMALKGRLSSLNADLTDLKAERRKIGDHFGSEGSPSRRIQGLENHITHVKRDFPAVYLRFGSLAEKKEGKDALSSILREEDETVLEKAELLNSRIKDSELSIEKVKAAISIDNEKAEIEKANKGILNQKRKITAANDAISVLNGRIAESERRIEELNTFLKENE